MFGLPDHHTRLAFTKEHAADLRDVMRSARGSTGTREQSSEPVRATPARPAAPHAAPHTGGQCPGDVAQQLI